MAKKNSIIVLIFFFHLECKFVVTFLVSLSFEKPHQIWLKMNLSATTSLAFYLSSTWESREIRQYIWTAALLEGPRSFLCPQPQQLVKCLIAGKPRLSILWEILFAVAVETFNWIEFKNKFFLWCRSFQGLEKSLGLLYCFLQYFLELY